MGRNAEEEEEEEEEENSSPQEKGVRFSTYKTRKIALEVAYCGAEHCGFSSQGAEVSNVRTVEGALFEALKKCRWDPSKEIFGEPSVEYSRCGRTDRGVSSLGNVVSLKVRSKVGDGEDGDEENQIDYVGYPI